LRSDEVARYAKLVKGFIVADGDIDGVFGARLLRVWLGDRFAGVKFPEPKEVRSLSLRDCISVELPPGRVASTSKVLVFDHHPRGLIAYYDEGGEEGWRVDLGEYPSISRMILEVLNVKDPVTEPYMHFVDIVDSNPRSLLNDPRYLGYRLAIDIKDWKLWVVNGEVEKAFDLFNEIGRTAVDDWLKDMERKVRVEKIDGLTVAFIVAEEATTAVVKGYRIRIEHSLSRILQLKLEEKHDYAVIVFVENGKPHRISISSPRHRNANLIASKLGGGGHPQVAGAPLQANDLEEAMRKVLTTLRDAVNLE